MQNKKEVTMSENEQTFYTSCGNSNASNNIVFHAVYIPKENDVSAENNIKGKTAELSIFYFLIYQYYIHIVSNSFSYLTENIRVYQDKIEALKVIKEFKTGRLKSFKKCSEAEEYAKTGFEKTNCVNNTLVPSTAPTVEEKSSNFKAPRSQELVCFRNLIKDGDLYAVKNTVWGNPRYLIGSGDTPAILHVR